MTYVIQWCYELPVDEFGDSDHDRARCRREEKPTREEAIARAREVARDAVYGYALVWEMRKVSAREARLSSLLDDANVHCDANGQWWEEFGEPEEVNAFEEARDATR